MQGNLFWFATNSNPQSLCCYWKMKTNMLQFSESIYEIYNCLSIYIGKTFCVQFMAVPWIHNKAYTLQFSLLKQS